MNPQANNEPHSPAADREAVLAILTDQRVTSDEARADLIVERFRRKPANYKRRYSDKQPDLAKLEKGDTIQIIGVGAFTITGTEPIDQGITLHLEAQQ